MGRGSCAQGLGGLEKEMREHKRQLHSIATAFHVITLLKNPTPRKLLTGAIVIYEF